MLKVLELFSGYGSQALALENLDIEFTSDISEIDKYAIEAYNQIHGQTKNYGDICKINEAELPEYDLITYSSPCQDFSIAGLRKGGDKDSGTRSSLLWECERIIRSVKPKYLLMENVKNLVGKRFKPCFDAWLRTLEEIGYRNCWKVLNAKDYGVPQNRERVFVVSIRKDLNQTYLFPEKQELKIRLKDILEKEVGNEFWVSDQFKKYMKGKENKKYNFRVEISEQDGIRKTPIRASGDLAVVYVGNCLYPEKGYTGHNYAGATFDEDGLSPNLTSMSGGNRQPFVLNRCKEEMIRRLTTRECWRLMGVKDKQFDRLHGISKTQLYKMAGNSIVVDVLMAIFKNLLISDKETKGQLSLL